MGNRSFKKPILVVLPLIMSLLSTPGGAESWVSMQGHVPKQLRSATMIERAPADESVQLSLVVHLDQNLLDQTLEQLYGRGAPAKKHFLSSSEFAQKFGLADKRQKLKDFALANGLTVDPTEDRPESMVVKVSGPANVVEKTFQVRLNHYRDAKGQIFRAHETDPMIPASLGPHLTAVLGLSNFVGAAHPHLRRPALSLQKIASRTLISGGTGPGGFLAPADIKAIYGLSSATLTGSGQTVAVFELDGYTPSDVVQYETTFSLPNIPITFIGVDGATNAPGAGADEVTLDIELVAAVAPGLAQILDYGGPNTEPGRNDTYNKIATDNVAKVVSTSWGLDEQNTDPAEISAENMIFQKMAAQGQSIYAAAGDCGAYDQQNNSGCITTNGLRVDNPASQPFVTGVGGTSLTGSVASPTETTWNEFSISNGGGGGGVSAVWSIPNYQAGVAGLASQTSRNVPDVALNADPDTAPYAIFFSGGWTGFGGTSAAAPLWAALTALLNQQSAANGTVSLGFANAVIYQQATSSAYHNLFNDITSGTNGASGGGFSAGPGYDNATGWGSYKGLALINSASGELAVITLNNLTNVYTYPNPWDVRKNPPSFVAIAGVPAGATVKIFTISGFLVKDLTATGVSASGVKNAVNWDLTNNSGQSVASGLYFYLVKTSDQTLVHGKIAIIR